MRELRVILRELIESGDVVVLNPCLDMDVSRPAVDEVVEDVVQDFLSVYGVARIAGDGRVLLHHPLALLELPATHADYLEHVGPKTRNMIRKADRAGYEFREFDWNDHLDEIFEINTSMPRRSGGPMRGWYTEPVAPRENHAPELRKYYGAFKDGRLCGYLHLVICGDFGFFRHFIGHADHLPSGIMNGLISWTVERHAGDTSVRWLKYGPLVRREDSTSAFKRHAGFVAYATFLNLAGREALLEVASNLRGECGAA